MFRTEHCEKLLLYLYSDIQGIVPVIVTLFIKIQYTLHCISSIECYCTDNNLDSKLRESIIYWTIFAKKKDNTISPSFNRYTSN